MSSVSPTHQDLSNDTTFSRIKSRVPVLLRNRFSHVSGSYLSCIVVTDTSFANKFANSNVCYR